MEWSRASLLVTLLFMMAAYILPEAVISPMFLLPMVALKDIIRVFIKLLRATLSFGRVWRRCLVKEHTVLLPRMADACILPVASPPAERKGVFFAWTLKKIAG